MTYEQKLEVLVKKIISLEDKIKMMEQEQDLQGRVITTLKYSMSCPAK